MERQESSVNSRLTEMMEVVGDEINSESRQEPAMKEVTGEGRSGQ